MKGNVMRSDVNPAYLVLVSIVVGFYLGHMGGGVRSMPATGTGCLPSSLAVQNVIDDSVAVSRRTSSSPADAGPGWHAVHVFYGDRNHLLGPHLHGPSASQEGQDQYALDLLHNKRGGFFVDLAANHPIQLSNTFILERDYDWDGLCIEPNWQYWNSLASLRRCKVIGAVGGGSKSEKITFRFHPFKRFVGAFGGIVGDQFDNKQDATKSEGVIEETRFTVALADILENFDAPNVIDYLSLDVEGAEDLILSEFPFHKYTFQVVNVERPSDKVRQLLIDNGYELLRTDKYGDTTWKHKSLN